MADAPIERLELDVPHEGMISAHREGEPSFRWVQGMGDAIMSANARGVELVVTERLLAELRSNGDLPEDWLPSCIRVKDSS